MFLITNQLIRQTQGFIPKTLESKSRLNDFV